MMVPSSNAADKYNCTVLPIPDPTDQPITELDARKVQAPPWSEVKAPKGAPNVVIVLTMDIGMDVGPAVDFT